MQKEEYKNNAKKAAKWKELSAILNRDSKDSVLSTHIYLVLVKR